ncbi:MAG: hypothetical protein IJ551_10085 [Prevotella sp.]|nr:hypothetical protein [Prevotella sp.]
MKKINLMLALLAVSTVTFAQSQQQERITIGEFAQKLQAAGPNAQVLDVRSRAEYEINHLAGAVNIDLADSAAAAAVIGRLDKSKPVFAYSIQSGRGVILARKLREQGFTQAYGMPGGIVNWVGSGYSLETLKTDRSLVVDINHFHSLIKSDKVVVVNYSSRHCGSCVRFAPTLAEIEKEFVNDISLIRVELDDNPELIKDQQIHLMPTMIIYKNGEVQWRKEGRQTREEIEEAIRKQII